MKTLTLKNKFQTNATLISNDFIDNYMIQANGEFVKVYLFLLRHLDDPYQTLTLSMIADCLNNTEKDILRAFRYWESQGLLKLEKDSEGQIRTLELNKIPVSASSQAQSVTNPNPVPAQSAPVSDSVTAQSVPVSDSVSTGSAQKSSPRAQKTISGKAIPLDSFKAQKELKSLLFIAEQYLGKTLTKTDVDTITYFYDTLGMSASLIEYLIESCVENNHKSIHYIRKVAIAWAEEGISTVEEARQQSLNYNKNCYTILNAFGIKNRGPADSELSYIRKWTEEFGFTLDIIREAVNRTVSATHQPSFEYADSILTRWKDSQVHHLQDIASLDDAFQKEKAAKKSSVCQKPAAKNMNNVERRVYDMNSLEERLLNSN